MPSEENVIVYSVRHYNLSSPYHMVAMFDVPCFHMTHTVVDFIKQQCTDANCYEEKSISAPGWYGF